ncbi:MAG: N-acetylgalactosamine 6-sulfate sulfatase, partial [Opitutae bacterium]|nr:N-acetylgalactosamine 6-sulfate sulfatase [Opitutae bacterium]
LDILGLHDSAMIHPYDGISLLSLFKGKATETRPQPLGFYFQNAAALVDNDYKLVLENRDEGIYQLFDLVRDPAETKDLFYLKPEVAARMAQEWVSWRQSVAASIAGQDYPEGRVDPDQPPRIFWWEMPQYEPYFQDWLKRPEYGDRLQGYLDGRN